VIGGDLAGNTVLWQWGGIAGEAAILLFLAATAHGVLSTRRQARGRSGQQANAAQIRQAPARG
jgi:hypothetical protein